MNTRVLTATGAALALAATAAATTAHAAPRNDRDHTVAISFSPIHLIFPALEVQAEFLVSDVVSLSIIGGFGQVTAEVNGVEEAFSIFEIGGQVRGYFYGGSEGGAYAGAEVMYLRVDGEVDGVTGLGVGTTIGPFVGYKWTWDNFFIDLNAGVQIAVIGAEAEDESTGEQDSKEDSSVLPLLNFGLGWSF